MTTNVVESETRKAYPDYFNGYCPESWLQGRTVFMQLNIDNFFESVETGLQIAVIHPGVQAVILKRRGKGLFKTPVKFAHETELGEFLLEQCSDRWPYCGNAIIRDNDHLKRYIESII
jgi:hypothetical protein